MVGELRDVCINLGERPDLVSRVGVLRGLDLQQAQQRAHVLSASLAEVRHQVRIVADDELPSFVTLALQGCIFNPAATIRRQCDEVLTG